MTAISNGCSLCVVCSSYPFPLLTKVGFIGSKSVQINFCSLFYVLVTSVAGQIGEGD